MHRDDAGVPVEEAAVHVGERAGRRPGRRDGDRPRDQRLGDVGRRDVDALVPLDPGDDDGQRDDGEPRRRGLRQVGGRVGDHRDPLPSADHAGTVADDGADRVYDAACASLTSNGVPCWQ